MKWVARVKSHGIGVVSKEYSIDAVFSVERFDKNDRPNRRSFYVNGVQRNCTNSSALGGGDWDVYEVPESRDEYLEQHQKCGIKEGDTVRIKRPFKEHHFIEGIPWSDTHEGKQIGKTCVVRVVGSDAYRLDLKLGSAWWPYFCLEKVESKAGFVKAELGEGDKCPKCEGILQIEQDECGWSVEDEPVRQFTFTAPSGIKLKDLCHRTIGLTEHRLIEKRRKKMSTKRQKIAKLMRFTCMIAGADRFLRPTVSWANPHLVMFMTSKVEALNNFPDAACWATVGIPAAIVAATAYKCRKGIKKAYDWI